MEWQDISTAPRDGTIIVLSNGDEVYVGAYGLGDNVCDRFMWAIMMDGWEENAWMDGAPTHWMPLPQPPETAV